MEGLCAKEALLTGKDFSLNRQIDRGFIDPSGTFRFQFQHHVRSEYKDRELDSHIDTDTL